VNSSQPSAKTVESFHAWLENPHGGQGPSIKSFATKAPSEKLASAAAVAGPRAAQDRAASKALAAKAKSDPGGAKADFKDRPMDGCTSLMNMARKKSGFDPTKGMTGTNVEAYNKYIEAVVKCPLFNLDMTDSQNIHKDSDNWDELINKVADTFEGIESDDKSRITKSITGLVQAASSNSNTDESTDLFVQSVLYAKDGENADPVYSIYIYSSHIHIIDNKSKGHESMQEDFAVQRTKMTFRINDWPYFSDKVWDKLYSSVDDWLNDNSTPTGNSKTLVTCLEAAE
jgi:hypothetical protein